MPARYDLEVAIWRGDTFALPLKFLDEGLEYNLEGRTLTFTLKQDHTTADNDALISRTVTFNVGDPGAASGDYTLLLQPSETGTLELGAYVYQVIITTPGAPEDEIVTWMWGEACVKDS